MKKLFVFLLFFWLLTKSVNGGYVPDGSYDPCDNRWCSGSKPSNCCSTTGGKCFPGSSAWTYYYNWFCAKTNPYCSMGGDWAWTARTCSAADTCRPGETGLRAGLCKSSGCGIGGIYKTCCNNGVPEACSGGEHTGTCPHQTVHCGYGGHPPCGAAACCGSPKCLEGGVCYDPTCELGNCPSDCGPQTKPITTEHCNGCSGINRGCCNECETCTLKCGQAKNCGGNCPDDRSTSLTTETSKTHDLPVSVSGHARDNNGATDGVEDVHIYYDCPSGDCSSSNFWTSFSANQITIAPADGSFLGNIKPAAMANLYDKTGGRDGENHNNHTLYFFAVQTESGTCGNWLFATKTINLTNTDPQNQSLKLCQTNDSCFCGTGLDTCQDKPILSFTINNILRVKAVFYDSDQFPTQPEGYIRESDIDEAYIIFDNNDDENDGFFYRIKYKDNVNNGNYSLTEDGGNKAHLIAIQNHSRSITESYKLNLTIDLDFTLYPKNDPFTSNIYMKVKDFAGKERKTEMVSTTFTTAPYWYKLKDASLNKKEKLKNYLNNNPSPYDIDDTSEKLLIIGSGGVVLVEESTDNSLGYTPIENYISSNRWLKQGYSFSTTPSFFVEQFLSYAKSRKLVKYITSVSDAEIESNKINIYKGSDVTLSNDITKQNFVVILRNTNDTGFVNLRIDKTQFNQSKLSQAFLAQTITFSDNTTEANGIFIAFSFNIKDPPLSTYITTPLKITGNLISLDEIADTTVRRRTDITKPSIFIVFNPKMYLDLLPYLSIAKYDYQQIQ